MIEINGGWVWRNESNNDTPFFDFINMPTGAVLIVYVFIEGICAIGLIRQSPQRLEPGYLRFLLALANHKLVVAVCLRLDLVTVKEHNSRFLARVLTLME